MVFVEIAHLIYKAAVGLVSSPGSLVLGERERSSRARLS